MDDQTALNMESADQIESTPAVAERRNNPSQFHTDRTHQGRWTIPFSYPPINMFVPTTIVELGALMTDLEVQRGSIPGAPNATEFPDGFITFVLIKFSLLQTFVVLWAFLS